MPQTGLQTFKRVAYYEFDFSVHGGAAEAITVNGDWIPPGAVINYATVHVLTAVTSAGAATVAIKAVGDDDIIAATAKTSLTAGALIDTVVVPNDGSSFIKVASTLKALTFTVATAALTAGKIVVALEYVTTS